MAPSRSRPKASCGFAIRLFLVTVLAQATIARLDAQERTTADVARRNSPTVVTISTPASSGSGVVVDQSGVIATALHVLKGASTASVRMPNGDTYTDIAIIDVDERRDIVLVKVKAFGLTSATMGNSDRVSVGDRVVLIGSPRGLDLTVSDGLVSAVRDSGDGYRLIQTNAAASPGSSGGGMFNQSGELIGIVASKVTTGENLNFAVPINYVRGMFSLQPKMTLAEMAVKYPSTPGPIATTPASSANQSAPTAAEAATTKRIEDLAAKSGLDLVRSREGVWSVSYRGDHLPTITVTVRSYESLILVQSTAAESPRLAESQLRQILTMSFDADLAKPALTEDGSLLALHELDSASATGGVLKAVVAAVANLADDLHGSISGAIKVDLPAISAVAGSDRSHSLLNRHTVDYRGSDWKEMPIEQLPGAKRTQWMHQNGEIWLAIIEERTQISLDQVLDSTLSNLKEVDPRATVRSRGTRLVNGVTMSYQQVAVKSDGVDVIFLGHYYSDTGGTIQITGWTAQNLFDEHRTAIERFVGGFRVKK